MLPKRKQLSNDDELPTAKQPIKYVVVGGGIAGVCCAKEMAQLHEDAEIVMISATDVMKEVLKIAPIYDLRSDIQCSLNLSSH